MLHRTFEFLLINCACILETIRKDAHRKKYDQEFEFKGEGSSRKGPHGVISSPAPLAQAARIGLTLG